MGVKFVVFVDVLVIAGGFDLIVVFMLIVLFH